MLPGQIGVLADKPVGGATGGLSWELLAETPSIEESGVYHARFIVGRRCTFD